MAIIKVITPSVTDANITTAKVTDNAITLAKMASGTDGNIISYDTSGNPVAIATGSDGQVLTSTGAGSPPAFEALPGGGKILQVITSNDSSTRSTTSTSFVTASSLLSINITPSASSSKIFFIGSISLYQTNGNAFPEITIYRDSTDLSGGAGLGGFRAGDGNQNMVFTAISHLDSPSSTSQITYRIYIKSGSGDSVALQQNNNISTFTAFEIGA